MNTELKTMTRKELEKHLVDTKKALQAAQARDRRNARKAAERAAAEYGFSLNELDENIADAPKKQRAVKKPKKPSRPKYADPDNPARTWTGKGRQPNWFRASVENGIAPEALEI